MVTDFSQNLASLRAAIHQELIGCGRSSEQIILVGASKKQTVATISTAIQSGLTDIGENYLQEAQAKFPLLPPVRKHFIGHLQTNKAKLIVELFDMVQSVDRPAAAIALGKAALLANKQLPVLLQLNISDEERFGCLPQDITQLVDVIHSQSHLSLEGIMAIAPITNDDLQISRSFALAGEICQQIGGKTLSLGMSHDWRLAIRAGANMLRIGTALFGAR